MFDFKEMTLSIIKEEEKENAKRLIERVFSPLKKQNNKTGILILGMNPAGDNNTAEEERNPNYFYLNYIGKPKGRIKERTNNRYFSPIWEFAKSITNNNAKWDWCNLDWQNINRKLIQDNFKEQEISQVKYFYDTNRLHKYTIYIGDAFYVHKTHQKKFEKMINDIDDYLIKIIKIHIDEIKNCNSNLKMIYVNNSTLSQWLIKALQWKGETTLDNYNYAGDLIPIAFGGMLSGQGAMDIFARQRLINEIKNANIL